MQLYGGGTHCVVLDLDLLPARGRAAAAQLFERRTAGHPQRRLRAALPRRRRHRGARSIEDTMQAAGLLLGVRQRSLEAAAGAYLGIALPKALQTSDWSAPQLSAPASMPMPRSTPSSRSGCG